MVRATLFDVVDVVKQRELVVCLVRVELINDLCVLNLTPNPAAVEIVVRYHAMEHTIRFSSTGKLRTGLAGREYCNFSADEYEELTIEVGSHARFKDGSTLKMTGIARDVKGEYPEPKSSGKSKNEPVLSL